MFVIDDDAIQTEMIKDYLKERYLFDLKTFENGEDAMADIKNLTPEIIVLDYHLNANKKEAKNGVEILKEIRTASPNTKVVMFSGQDNINIALDSMRNGAYDYIIKGETAFNKLENTINKLGETHKLEAINKAQRNTITFLGAVIGAIILGAIIFYIKTN
jgi:DNA-binding NtrC family response regulator